jgi:hypothetical protein
MSTSKPASCHLNCWGLKYQDGDRECEQCRWNDTCRSRMFEVAASVPLRSPTVSLPVYQPRPVLAPVGVPVGTVPMPPARTTMTPTYSPSAQPPAVQPRYTTPSAPTPPPPPQTGYPQQYPQYHQTYQGYSIPNPHKPNPMEPMFRPGAQGPAYYFNQYPEESVGTRLTKNMLLRGLEAVFSELSYFFRHWTWPSIR